MFNIEVGSGAGRDGTGREGGRLGETGDFLPEQSDGL